MAYNLLADMLRALGDSHSPLLTMMLSSIVNMLLETPLIPAFQTSHFDTVGCLEDSG